MASIAIRSAAVPPGQSPPLYTITDTDQVGTVVIVTAVCIITALVSILVRAYVLLQTGSFRLRWDDSAIALALLLSIIQTSLVQREAALGLGRTIQDNTSGENSDIQQFQFADQIFYVLAVWTCKVSAALFFHRLSPKRSDRRISEYILGFIGITGVVSILLLSLVCNLSQPWQYFTAQGTVCSAPYDRWIAVQAFNIATEVALGCLVIKIFWPLQMRFSTKCAAGFIFLQRFILIAPIAGQLHFLSIVYHSRDTTLEATYSTLCKEIEVALANVVTNIQCFRPFLLAAATNYGAPTEEALSNYVFGQDTELSERNVSKRSRNSAQLQSRQSRHSKQEPATSRADFSPSGTNHFSARVTSGADQNRDSASVGTDDSANLIIRKDLDYMIQYQDTEAAVDDSADSDHIRPC